MTVDMNTGKNKLLEPYLQQIPAEFRDRIIEEYLRIKFRYQKGEYDSSGLSCGKFCEDVLRFLQHHLTGHPIDFKTDIGNFALECNKLEKTPKTAGCDSLRIIIPRALSLLYTMRNKRNIGHSGGDVEANQIDSVTIGRVSDWIVCELIRVFHNNSLEEAQQIVDLISTRSLPDVWEVNGKKRVLKNDMSTKDKVLLLSYNEQSVLIEDMILWIGYSNTTEFRSKVLQPLHKSGLIEFDQELNMIILSPKGCKEVEERILSVGDHQLFNSSMTTVN